MARAGLRVDRGAHVARRRRQRPPQQLAVPARPRAGPRDRQQRGRVQRPRRRDRQGDAQPGDQEGRGEAPALAVRLRPAGVARDLAAVVRRRSAQDPVPHRGRVDGARRRPLHPLRRGRLLDARRASAATPRGGGGARLLAAPRRGDRARHREADDRRVGPDRRPDRRGRGHRRRDPDRAAAASDRRGCACDRSRRLRRRARAAVARRARRARRDDRPHAPAAARDVRAAGLRAPSARGPARAPARGRRARRPRSVGRLRERLGATDPGGRLAVPGRPAARPVARAVAAQRSRSASSVAARSRSRRVPPRTPSTPTASSASRSSRASRRPCSC